MHVEWCFPSLAHDELGICRASLVTPEQSVLSISIWSTYRTALIVHPYNPFWFDSFNRPISASQQEIAVYHPCGLQPFLGTSSPAAVSKHSAWCCAQDTFMLTTNRFWRAGAGGGGGGEGVKRYESRGRCRDALPARILHPACAARPDFSVI